MERLIVILAVLSACLADRPDPPKEFACKAPNGGGLQAALSKLVWTKQEVICLEEPLMVEILEVFIGNYTGIKETQEYRDMKEMFCKAYVDIEPYTDHLMYAFHDFDLQRRTELNQDSAKYVDALTRCSLTIFKTLSFRTSVTALQYQVITDPYALEGSRLIFSKEMYELVSKFFELPQFDLPLQKLKDMHLTIDQYFAIYPYFFLAFFNMSWQI